MSGNLLAVLGIILVLLLLFYGANIGLSLIAVGFVGYAIIRNVSASIVLLRTTFISTLMNSTYIVIPLFILMGNFAWKSGISDDMFNAAKAWFGRTRGGLAYAAVVACAAFGAICGAIQATTATMCNVGKPVMRENNYKDEIIGGTLATGGTLRQGHSMSQVLYDVDLAMEDNIKYHLDYEPDMGRSVSEVMAGEGSMMEKLGVKFLRWAGEPGINIDKNSIHQFIEKEYLEEDEYPDITQDYSGWIVNKYLPRCYELFECMEGLNIPGMVRGKPGPLIRQFKNPKIAEAVVTLGELAKEYITLDAKLADHSKKLKELGFPSHVGAGCTTAFDMLSDSLRGTLGIMMDVITQPEEVLEAVGQFHERNIQLVRKMYASGMVDGGWFIPMHKGFDGFLSPQQYEKFYYPTLKGLVEEIVKCGGTPIVYTEGKYDSRLEILSDLPANKVIINIENCNMKDVKRILGGNHCISGGFKYEILKSDNPDKIKDEVKKFLDIVAPGGGYIFDVDYTIDDVSDKAFAALVDAVKSYK